MASKIQALRSDRALAIRSVSSSAGAAPITSANATHLNTAIAIYAAIEFLAVTSSAYFVGLFYHGIALGQWETSPQYILAALFIATLADGLGGLQRLRQC